MSAILELGGTGAGKRVWSAEIAERQEIPAPFLAKILPSVASAGIVSSYRGVNGGAILARPATGISLPEVVEAIEGSVALNRCQPCPDLWLRDCDCGIHPAWGLVRGQLRNSINEVKISTVAGVAAQPKASR